MIKDIDKDINNISKDESARNIVDYVRKNFGKNSIIKMDEVQAESQSDMIVPTGSIGLDLALGVGGLTRGRIVEIFGPESAGKTTLALHVIAEAQKLGGNCVLVDTEHALDPVYAARLGVDMSKFFLVQPDTGEQALEITNVCARAGGMDVVIVDSVAALIPKAELEGDIGDSHIGLQARLMSQALKKLTLTISQSKCLLIFVNQTRAKIGMTYGSSETTTGGNALKFYASARIEARRVTSVKDSKGNETGMIVRFRVLKNKLDVPFKFAECTIVYGEGISRLDEIVDIAMSMEIIKRAGAWFYYGDMNLGQGKESVKSYLVKNKEIADKILSMIFQNNKKHHAASSQDNNTAV